MSEPLAKVYDPQQVESGAYDRWMEKNDFHADPRSGGRSDMGPYAIVIPPPNVTGALHMGHALNNTIQDILIRWRRMAGYNAMWMPGTDHAGIATQTVVEKRVLAEEGKRRTDFAREEFVEKIQAWKDDYEARITHQLQAMGCSCDWQRQRFTMDPVCARAVREAFFRLFKDGLIYRGKRLVNWDPVTQTALADDEVEMQDIDGHFWYLRYPLAETVEINGEVVGHVTVATTRPETMLGDTAVAINPTDPRAPYLRGKSVKLPIVDRVIPIVEDDYVVLPDPEGDDPKAKFATGFLKVTPAHDPNDWEIGQRHNLPVINIMAPDGTISVDYGWKEAEENIHEAANFLGMDRFEAREAIVTWFRNNNLLEEVKPYTHTVGHSYRSHVPIEPYLSDQWYVKVTDDRLAGAALRAMKKDQRSDSDGCVWTKEHPFETNRDLQQETTVVTSPDRKGGGSSGRFSWEGGLTFYPDRYAKTFQSWHENIRDWCISRQLWWGHRIPVWKLSWGVSTTDGEQIWEDSEVLSLLDGWINETDIRNEVILRRPSETDKYIFICTRYPSTDEKLSEFRDVLYKADRATDETYGEKILLGPHLAQTVTSLEQDPDVLDTWFSSALWPVSTLGWPTPSDFPEDFPEGDATLEAWNPSNTLCTAREIITLWVSRMVMFNVYFRDCLPFADVFIHAMIQDGEGQKMSKNLGNGVDPLDIIHSHGADAMRFTLAWMTTLTQDVRMPVDIVCPHCGSMFSPKMVTNKAGYRVAAPIQECPSEKGRKMATSYGVVSGEVQPTEEIPLARNTSSKFDVGRNFCNKLWNACRFALMNLEDGQAEGKSEGKLDAEDHPLPHGRGSIGALNVSSLEWEDRWILSRLATTAGNVTGQLEGYKFSDPVQELYKFFWNDLCDWYLEIIKPRMRDAGKKPAAQQALAYVLDATLRLLHPFIPFITEQLYQQLHEMIPQRQIEGLPPLAASDDLIAAAWPDMPAELIAAETEQEMELVQAVIPLIRDVRSRYNVPPKEKVDASIKAPAAATTVLNAQAHLIGHLANVADLSAGPQTPKPANAAVAVEGQLEIYVHNVIDAEAEKQRLLKQRAELAGFLTATEKKLANENFVSRAKPEVVQRERDKLTQLQEQLATVESNLQDLN